MNSVAKSIPRRSWNPRRVSQIGSALAVSVLVLLLLTIAVMVAVPAVLGEQRISGNDVRAKISQHVAEAGLSHGREFLRANQSTIMPDPGEAPDPTLWIPCSATETAFPCGVIESDKATSTIRAGHYRYIGGSDGRSVTFAPGKLYDGSGTDAGNFDAVYDVGVVMCRLDTSRNCVTAPAAATGTTMFTLVSRGGVTGEGASQTVSETIGTFRIVNLSAAIPPIMAAGTITGLGNSTIVGNPNAGGFGVPLSVWARNDFDGTGGSWQTCQLDEYLRSNLGAVVMEGKLKNVPTCSDCDCKPADQLSNKNLEGIDILDSNDADGGKAKAGADYYYPCDMFEYVFDFKAREDNDGDGVCETPITSGGDPAIVDVVEWLTANAQIMTCEQVNGLGKNASGVIWVQSPCDAGNKLTGRIGSPDNPVLLVSDGSLQMHTNVEFFGIIFLRYTGTVASFKDCVTNGSGCPELRPGGGGAQIYGSVVIEGGGKINGTVDLVYLPQLITIFNRSPGNNRFAGLPGSWSDRVAY
jgi:hypothetical protein